MSSLSAADQQKQAAYRDARRLNKYDDIWQNVGKCVFCDLNEKYIFFEEHDVVMTISLFAYIDGHFMIIPRRHVRSAKELSELEWATIRKFTYIAKKIIKDVHHIKGMQLIQKDGADAQSTVEHIHFHCVPFDAPDLMQWNYRQLKHTPLENVSLYKQARKDIVKYDKKFTEKYQNQSTVPIVCDLLLINKKGEVLLQERSEGAKLSPDYLTLPGGTVDNFQDTLENELVREVKEEINLDLQPEQFSLLLSRLADRTIIKTSVHLQTAYDQNIHFLWNTYVLADYDVVSDLTPGDDCQAIVWLPLQQIATHPRVSAGIQHVVAQFLKGWQGKPFNV